MNEDEAKMKWCPFARVVGTLRQPAAPGAQDYVVGQGSQNRGFTMGGALDNCLCIASACMAWRVSDLHRGRVQGKAGQDFIAKDVRDYEAASGGSWTVTRLPYEGGYCGLAGAPQ